MAGKIRRYTLEEIRKMKKRTDLGKVRRTTEQDIMRQVEQDLDDYLPSDQELKQFRPARHRPGRRRGRKGR